MTTRTTQIKKDILSGAISPYKDKCDGYGNSHSSGNNYILGMALAIGKSEALFEHPGSLTLDEINAFDLAEVEGPYIGQINMSIVSSFCGPQGLIWGYDLCPSKEMLADSNLFKKVEYKNKLIDVYNIDPLIDATKKLFGTVNDRRYNLRPGAHVPFASKNKKIKGPGIVYAGIAIGIPKNREENACLLMEDYGLIPSDKKPETFVTTLKENLAKSVIQIGINQLVEYEKIFVGIKYVLAKENEVACALIAAPYFTIAQNALIKPNDLEHILSLDIDQWESEAI